jgi:hypothetical protein
MKVDLFEQKIILLLLLFSSVTVDGVESFLGLGIYGSTVCAVSACIAASRMGINCTMVEPQSHLFGMTTGGLSGVDLRMSLGGIALEIFGKHPFPNFPPHVLNETIYSLLQNSGPGIITIEKNAGDIVSIVKKDSRIINVLFTSGFLLSAEYFLDCSYEGDLLRLSNISYAIGRESSLEFNESFAGVNGGKPWNSSILIGVSPFIDSSNSTLIETVIPQPNLEPNDGDKIVQAYNYRLILTNNASNRLPLLPPSNYTPSSLEFLRRFFLANPNLANENLTSLFLVRELGESKIDVNQADVLPGSSDMPFLQAAYPLANWTIRKQIADKHEWWTRAVWEFLRTDDSVPTALRSQARTWGLAADEFLETGGFSPQLYVRESIRMRGEKILSQQDVFGTSTSESNTSVGLSQWLIDVHDTQRIATLTTEGYLVAEAGNVNSAHKTWQLTEIPYEAFLPRRIECENLAVPICASFTHIGFATFRLEPQYAIFGQSLAVAAVLAIRSGHVAFQDLNITSLQNELIEQGQLIHTGVVPPTNPSQLVLANCSASTTQDWNLLSDGSIRDTSGYCVSIFAYSNETGAKAVAAECHTDKFPKNQAFDLPTLGNGSFQVRSLLSKLCLTPLSNSKDGEIIQEKCSDVATKWEGINNSVWHLLNSSFCVAYT